MGLLYLGSVHHKAEKSAKKEKNKGDKPGEVEWEHLTVQGNGESNQFLIPCFLFPFFFFHEDQVYFLPNGLNKISIYISSKCYYLPERLRKILYPKSRKIIINCESHHHPILNNQPKSFSFFLFKTLLL